MLRVSLYYYLLLHNNCFFSFFKTHILKSCNTDNLTVIVHSDTDVNIIKSLGDSETTVMILLSNSSTIHSKSNHKTKIDAFITTTDSVKELSEILFTFKLSPWWNIMIPVFALSKSKGSCNDAQVTLKTIWKMNILISYFICFDSQQKPFIYTFNPYAKRAPHQWKIIDEYTNKSSYWTLFNRPYHQSKTISLYFNF